MRKRVAAVADRIRAYAKITAANENVIGELIGFADDLDRIVGSDIARESRELAEAGSVDEDQIRKEFGIERVVNPLYKPVDESHSE